MPATDLGFDLEQLDAPYWLIERSKFRGSNTDKSWLQQGVLDLPYGEEYAIGATVLKMCTLETARFDSNVMGIGDGAEARAEGWRQLYHNCGSTIC